MVENILVETNLHLAVKLQSDLINSSDTISRLNFGKKIKDEIEPKFYLRRKTSNAYKYLAFNLIDGQYNGDRIYL